MVRLYRKYGDREYRTEAKQVGTLYHVCTLDAFANKIIEDRALGTKNNLHSSGKYWNDLYNTYDAISFTRDSSFVVATPSILKASILFQLVVDGDKLSEHYKVTPYQDVKFTFNNPYRSEKEEVVIGQIKNLKSYIKEVRFDIKDIELSDGTTTKQILHRLKKIKRYLGTIKCSRTYLPIQQFYGFNFTYNKKRKNTNFKINTLDDLINYVESIGSTDKDSKISYIDTPDTLIKNIDRLNEKEINDILEEYPYFASSIPLVGATAPTNFNLVKKILELSSYSNINMKDKDGDTILINYCYRNNPDIIEYLVSKGADVNVKTDRGETPLDIVCNNSDLSDDETYNLVNMFLKHGAKIDSDNVRSCLTGAMFYNKQKTCMLLLEHGADVNTKYLSKSILYYACKWRNIPLIQTLLEHGADPNIGDTYYNVPCLEVFIKDNYGKIDSTSYEAIKLLLKYGADPDIEIRRGSSDSSIITIACMTNNIELVKLLLDYHAKINNQNLFNNPLYYASYDNNLEIIEELLKQGADLSLKLKDTQEQGTILTFLSSIPSFRDKVKIDVFKLLLNNGGSAIVDTPDSNGYTPLYYACSKSQIQRIRLFLKYGAKVNKLGSNPLKIFKDNRVNDLLEKYL